MCTWLSDQPHFRASSRMLRLNMSLPVKYNKLQAHSSMGTTIMSTRR